MHAWWPEQSPPRLATSRADSTGLWSVRLSSSRNSSTKLGWRKSSSDLRMSSEVGNKIAGYICQHRCYSYLSLAFWLPVDSVEEIGFLRSHRDEALATAAEAMTRGRQRQSTSLGIQEAATTLTGIEGSRRASISTAGVPSPDIDSADETSQQEPSSIDHELCKPKSILLPSSSSTNRTAIVRASPSKLPVSATSTPDISPSVPLEKGKERLPSPIHNPLIARSSNARNLSYLARKSVTPKAIRDKRTDGIVGEMQGMTSRMQKLTQHLNNRRESMGASSAIPRARPSILPTTPLPPVSSSSSSTSSLAGMARSGSFRRNMANSPSINIQSKGQPLEIRQPLRPASRLGNSHPSEIPGSYRPPSRISVPSSRPVTPSARSPTPPSNYAGLGLASSTAASTRVPSRRISVGPGARRPMPVTNAPPVPNGIRLNGIEVSPATRGGSGAAPPAWR